MQTPGFHVFRHQIDRVENVQSQALLRRAEIGIQGRRWRILFKVLDLVRVFADSQDVGALINGRRPVLFRTNFVENFFGFFALIPREFAFVEVEGGQTDGGAMLGRVTILCAKKRRSKET